MSHQINQSRASSSASATSVANESIDSTSVAKAYIEVWNETDRARRMSQLQRHWAADAHYVDPMMSGAGIEQISELIAAVHSRFPSFQFTLLGEPDGYADHVRFKWSLGPQGLAAQDAPIKGSDVVVLRSGRLHSVIGFLDEVPAA
jgi:hypothetical protein